MCRENKNVYTASVFTVLNPTGDTVLANKTPMESNPHHSYAKSRKIPEPEKIPICSLLPTTSCLYIINLNLNECMSQEQFTSKRLLCCRCLYRTASNRRNLIVLFRFPQRWFCSMTHEGSSTSNATCL